MDQDENKEALSTVLSDCSHVGVVEGEVKNDIQISVLNNWVGSDTDHCNSGYVTHI